MPRRTGRASLRGLFLPELVEPVAGPWTIHQVDVRDSAVDTEKREAWVPVAHTPAQRLARLHELGHVKYSPSPDQPDGGWPATFGRVMALAKERTGVTPEYQAAVHLSKMLEENRIDWLLWDKHGVDLRPAREAFEWSVMRDPDDLLDAVGWCLQLAWTVWASRGLSTGKGTLNMPPPRTPDPDCGTYFDKAWKYVLDQNRDVAMALVRGCLSMYAQPTDQRRDEVAADLASFFPAKEREEPKPPPPKREEVEAERESRRREQEYHEYKEEQETGVGGEVVTDGHVQIHDHTANIRRPTMRIARRRVPVSQGVDMRFAHRYLMDRGVFSQRLLTEGSLMIDGSGSMNWTNADLEALMQVLPAIQIGIYSGFNDYGPGKSGIYGRICIIAKKGRFARYDGLDRGATEGNDVDYEALRMLATWPKPRFWLSDGGVCGGMYSGKPSEQHEGIGWYHPYGLLHDKCNDVMKRAEILRIPDLETMHKMLKRQRVRLFRSTRAPEDAPHGMGHPRLWPPTVKPQPVQFTL